MNPHSFLQCRISLTIACKQIVNQVLQRLVPDGADTSDNLGSFRGVNNPGKECQTSFGIDDRADKRAV